MGRSLSQTAHGFNTSFFGFICYMPSLYLASIRTSQGLALYASHMYYEWSFCDGQEGFIDWAHIMDAFNLRKTYYRCPNDRRTQTRCCSHISWLGHAYLPFSFQHFYSHFRSSFRLRLLRFCAGSHIHSLIRFAFFPSTRYVSPSIYHSGSPFIGHPGCCTWPCHQYCC